MADINVMKRYEYKYIVSLEQINALKNGLVGHMEIDKFGITSIESLYYDTIDYRLIRKSIEKPNYKEKIRLRSYGIANKDSKVFLELKRKYNGIVYKRRMSLDENKVEKFFKYENDLDSSQIAKEITYFRDYYKSLIPSCLIIYDRAAYFEVDGDLRLTIDYNPRYRVKDLNLHTSLEGIPLLDKGYAILEIKVQDSMPLWLSHLLDDNKIFKASFSKYGTAYKMIQEKSLDNLGRSQLMYSLNLLSLNKNKDSNYLNNLGGLYD
jgi:SPX domain protein involved in polyphosphate accumulation